MPSYTILLYNKFIKFSTIVLTITEINFWEISIVIERVMAFLEKITIFLSILWIFLTLKPVKCLKLSSRNR